jgi:hypothetical protein
MPQYNILLDLDDADTDGLADGLTDAGPWDIDDFEAGAPTDGVAHQLSITSTDDISDLTITLTGTDADDKPISEEVTGPNNTTVESTSYFKTLTGVSASATLGSETMDIGWVDEAVSATHPLNYNSAVPAGLYRAIVTGTIDFDVEFFLADPGRYNNQSDIPAVVDADLDGETATVQAWIEEMGYFGFRLKVNSYSSGAAVRLLASQPYAS